MTNSNHQENQHILSVIIKWYAYIFAATFILYGGVKIVLGIMDNNNEGFDANIVFLVLGVILMAVAIGFRDARQWGWYGLIGINALVVVYGIFHLSQSESVVLLVLSGLALVGLFLPATKEPILRR